MFVAPIRCQNLAFKCENCRTKAVTNDQKSEEVGQQTDDDKNLKKAIEEMTKVKQALTENIESFSYRPAMDYPQLIHDGVVDIFLKEPNWKVHLDSDQKFMSGSIIDRETNEELVGFSDVNRIIAEDLSDIVEVISHVAFLKDYNNRTWQRTY